MAVATEIAQKIVEEHLQLFSKESLNVSRDECQRVEAYLQFHSATPNVSTFQNLTHSIQVIVNQVMLTWKEDVFPRFFRSKVFTLWFHNLVSKKNKVEASGLLRQVSILRHIKNKKRPDVFYDVQEFLGKARCINTKDSQFVEMLLEDDNHWKMLFADKTGTSVFYSKKPFLTDLKKRYLITKSICYLPFDLETTLGTMFSFADGTDPNTKLSTHLGYLQPSSPDEYYTTMIGNVIDLGPMKRKCLESATVYYSTAFNGYGLLFRSFGDYEAYQPSIKMKATGIGCKFLQKIDSHRTKYTSLLMFNSGGFVDKLAYIMVKVNVERAKMIQRSIIQVCTKHVEASDKSKPNASWYSDDSCGAINTLEDNMKARFPKEEYPAFLNSETVQYYPDRRTIPQK